MRTMRRCSLTEESFRIRGVLEALSLANTADRYAHSEN
jgi:hypothetical protein